MQRRADLDGLRIRTPSTGEVWLMFHGVRHYITSPAVYDAMFSNLSVRDVPETATIMRGADLVDGAVLVRGGDCRIFLVTAVNATEVRRFRIVDWETFQTFGFDIDLVKDVPDILISAVADGPPILIEYSTDRLESARRSSGMGSDRLAVERQRPLF